MLLGILGATGKFGACIYSLAQQDPTISSIYPASRIRQEGFLDRKTAIEKSDVIIDVSSWEATKEHIEWAASQKKPIVIGSTGHQYPLEKFLEEQAQSIPIFYASNFSLGIAFLLETVRRAHSTFPKKEVHIEETHHIHKKDRPSGSALSIAKQMPQLSIDIVSHRRDEVIGDHKVEFHLEEEVVTISHHAVSRKAFAKGALNAAHFLLDAPPGLYTMNDLLSSKFSLPIKSSTG